MPDAHEPRLRHFSRIIICWVRLFLWLVLIPCAHAEEPDDTRIIERILHTRQAILNTSAPANSQAPPVFLAFWDFDGTILKGDCSEGLKDGNKVVYPGLAQVAIENGLSAVYPAKGGYDRFLADYSRMDQIGHWLSYPFIPQMLRGGRVDEVLRLSQTHFANVLSNYLMASSVKIMQALQRGGVDSHVISASADFFVKGAAESVGIPAHHIHGIEVKISNGQLTEQIIYPITWSTGKLERLKQIVAETEYNTGKQVYVLAGFGDSYHTDGPYLEFIARQSLPAGEPMAVFYGTNTIVPAEYKGLFYHAEHTATISDKPRR